MKILKQIIILFMLYLFSEAVTNLFSLPLPATIVSMLFFVILLLSGVLKEEMIAEGSSLFLTIMPILYIPVGAEILAYVDYIKSDIVGILVVVIASTLVTFFVTYEVVTMIIKRGTAHGTSK